MDVKLPLKLKIKYLNAIENNFSGKAVFHNENYSINIHGQSNGKIIKVPFYIT